MKVPNIQNINIKPIEEMLSTIDDLLRELFIANNVEKQKQLEYHIYELGNAISDITRIVIRNRYILQDKKDELFKQRRDSEKSDLATMKSVNKELSEENNLINLQDSIVDRLDNRMKYIIRAANHINDMRIAELAALKRDVM